MYEFKDVYFRVDSYLMAENFYNCTVGEQKELVEEGLKEYLLEKIGIIDLMKGLTLEKKKDELSLDDLVSILGELLPKEEHFNTLRHLTHYILNVAGTMQNFSITWWEEQDRSLIDEPQIKFDSEGRWDSLTCHKDTSYVQAFQFAHQIFMNDFKNKSKDNKQLVFLPAKKSNSEDVK